MAFDGPLCRDAVRVHATTRRVVAEAFAEEMPKLQELPSLPFGVSHEGMGGNLYSVPDATRKRVVEVHTLAGTVKLLALLGRAGPDNSYRFPPAIISRAIWLHFRFPLSLRMVEEMLAARGIVVSHETVRQWALKFGQGLANEIRGRLPRAGDKWHLDEVVIKIAGTTYWLW